MVDARRDVVPVGAAAEEERARRPRPCSCATARSCAARPPSREACIGRPSIGPVSRALLGHVDGTGRRSSRRRSRAASRCGRHRSAAGNASVGLPHDEAKADIIGDVRADAVGDGGADLGALVLGHVGAVEPAAAEGRDPLGDAMLDRGRPLDQPGVDLARSRRPRRRRRTPRATRTSCAASTGGAIAADDQLLVERLAQRRRDCPRRPSRRRSGRRASARGRSPAPPAPSRAPSAASRWRKRRRTRSRSCMSAASSSTASTPLRPRRRDHARANCRCRARVAPRSTILFGQRPVAAADVEDMLARLRVEQVERRLAQARRRSRRRAHNPRRPICWSRRVGVWLKASSPTRDRQPRPSARRARPDRRA